jgi:hypothetical protein
MANWFGLNPLDVILGTVAFGTVVYAVLLVCTALRNHRVQKRAGKESNRTIDLTH